MDETYVFGDLRTFVQDWLQIALCIVEPPLQNQPLQIEELVLANAIRQRVFTRIGLEKQCTQRLVASSSREVFLLLSERWIDKSSK